MHGCNQTTNEIAQQNERNISKINEEKRNPSIEFDLVTLLKPFGCYLC